MKQKTTKKRREVPADPSVRRFAAAMEKQAIPVARRRKAVAGFAAAMAEERLAMEAVRRVLEQHEVNRVAVRRSLNALARGIAGVLRRGQPERRALEIAARVRVRVDQGLDRGLVMEVLHAVAGALNQGPGLVAEVGAELGRMSARPAEPGKRPEPRGEVNVTVERGLRPELLAELEQPSDAELFQQREAVGMLREALAQVKPWARKVVVGRLGHRLGDRELAERNGLKPAEVADILKQARVLVHGYTRYFDDDWYWQDVPVRAGQEQEES